MSKEADSKKPTAAEYKARIETVRQMLVCGASRPAILKHCADKWSLAERQADELIARARKEIQDTPMPDKIEQKKNMIEQLNMIRYKADQMQDYQRVQGAVDRISRLMGLDEPEKQTLVIEGLDLFGSLIEAANAAGVDLKPVIKALIQEIQRG